MHNNCTTCKHFKKVSDKHGVCESEHLLTRSARLPLSNFITFICSEHESKDK